MTYKNSLEAHVEQLEQRLANYEMYTDRMLKHLGDSYTRYTGRVKFNDESYVIFREYFADSIVEFMRSLISQKLPIVEFRITRSSLNHTLIILWDINVVEICCYRGTSKIWEKQHSKYHNGFTPWHDYVLDVLFERYSKETIIDFFQQTPSK
jgi:hypothetical protein